MVKRSTSVLSFAPSPFVHFTESSRFLTEVQETAASAELVDATLARAMDVDGNLEGQDLRMTAAAFSDLCALTQLNEAYVRRVAQRNEPLAVDVIRDAMSCGLLRGCSYLVDKREKRIDAVVIDAKHNPPDYAALVRNALSASRETRFLGGWISGTRFRVTASAGDVRDVKTGKSAKVGDLVGTGFEILTDLGRPGCTSITDYAERLSCTNGMIATAEPPKAIKSNGPSTIATRSCLIARSWPNKHVAFECTPSAFGGLLDFIPSFVEPA